MSFIGRLTIRGEIEVLTGLHIGTGGSAGIGLIDNPVIRDPLTGRPIIPGSSLKGRLRHALEDLLGSEKDREVLRLFGAAPEDNEGGRTRLYVRDCHLVKSSVEKLMTMPSESLYVEIKTENRISRDKGVAEHPRQSERLPAGTFLKMELVYVAHAKDEVNDDVQNIDAALNFVEDEYLGGSGSRGYGKVHFHITEICWKTGQDYLTASDGSSARVSRADWIRRAHEVIAQSGA